MVEANIKKDMSGRIIISFYYDPLFVAKVKDTPSPLVGEGQGEGHNFEELRRELVSGKYRPEKWLFGGAKEGRYLSPRTADKIFRNACDKAGIKKAVSLHVLRHSFWNSSLGVRCRFEIHPGVVRPCQQQNN
jgi:hypothetical protein